MGAARRLWISGTTLVPIGVMLAGDVGPRFDRRGGDR